MSGGLRRWGRGGGSAALGLLVVKALWVWGFRVSARELLDGGAQEDLMTRRAYLLHRLAFQKGEGDSPAGLPEKFRGEWALGTLSMSSTAMVQMSLTDPEIRAESRDRVAQWIDEARTPALQRFDTRAWGRSALDTLAEPEGHLGYLGHLNLLLASHKYLGGDHRFDALHRRITEALRAKLERSPVGVAETYPGEVYVPDVVAAVASIALYEKAATGDSPFARRWVARARKRLLDPETSALPFSVDLKGRRRQGPRGCGMGWNSYYLGFIDPEFNREQYVVMKKIFAGRAGGIVQGIREWPRGVHRGGDVDSGPLIGGLTPSGTGFAIAGAVLNDDRTFLEELLKTSEWAGFTVQWKGRRRYLTAPLVGDAILLSMKSARPWDNRYLLRDRR